MISRIYFDVPGGNDPSVDEEFMSPGAGDDVRERADLIHGLLERWAKADNSNRILTKTFMGHQPS
jgi:hypothetical protein